MKAIPHTTYPMSAEVAEEATSLDLARGGRRFDSSHVSTAKRCDLAILTSDKYTIDRSSKLGISVVGLSGWKEEHRGE
jgi:predicted nucleic acid-binding protein